MSLGFLIAIFMIPLSALADHHPSHAPIDPSSTGLAPESEVPILWKNGNAAYDNGNFELAVSYFKRLIDRHAGAPEYLETQFLLGKAYLNLGQSSLALVPLKYYVNAAGKKQEPWLGLAALIEADLALKKNEEAYLNSLQFGKENSPASARAEGLLLKSRALQALGQIHPAELALEAADPYLLQAGLPRLHGLRAWVELKLKACRCSLLSSEKTLEEDQVRDQLLRRGTCLSEALVPFRKALEAADSQNAEKAEKELLGAFQTYSNACGHFPLPKAKRTSIQTKRYRAELRLLLKKDCNGKIMESVNILDSWKTAKKSIPETTMPYFEHAMDQMKRLFQNEQVSKKLGNG